MRLRPAPLIWTSMDLAPASRAFSRSSFTTEDGRSITSPAAIWSARIGGRDLDLRLHEFLRRQLFKQDGKCPFFTPGEKGLSREKILPLVFFYLPLQNVGF